MNVFWICLAWLLSMSLFVVLPLIKTGPLSSPPPLTPRSQSLPTTAYLFYPARDGDSSVVLFCLILILMAFQSWDTLDASGSFLLFPPVKLEEIRKERAGEWPLDPYYPYHSHVRDPFSLLEILEEELRRADECRADCRSPMPPSARGRIIIVASLVGCFFLPLHSKLVIIEREN